MAPEKKKNSQLSPFEQQILSEINFGYIGSYPLAGMGEPWIAKLEETHAALKKKGIGAILTLTEDNPYGDHHKKNGFLNCHVPVNDTEAPTPAAMKTALCFMNAAIEKGKNVAVHCLEGRGRSGTVLCAWLGIKENLSGEDAIKRIYELRPCSVITGPQRDFLSIFLKTCETD